MYEGLSVEAGEEITMLSSVIRRLLLVKITESLQEDNERKPMATTARRATNSVTKTPDRATHADRGNNAAREEIDNESADENERTLPPSPTKLTLQNKMKHMAEKRDEEKEILLDMEIQDL